MKQAIYVTRRLPLWVVVSTSGKTITVRKVEHPWTADNYTAKQRHKWEGRQMWENCTSDLSLPSSECGKISYISLRMKSCYICRWNTWERLWRVNRVFCSKQTANVSLFLGSQASTPSFHNTFLYPCLSSKEITRTRFVWSFRSVARVSEFERVICFLPFTRTWLSGDHRLVTVQCPFVQNPSGKPQCERFSVFSDNMLIMVRSSAFHNRMSDKNVL